MHSDRKRTLVHMYRHVLLLSITNTNKFFKSFLDCIMRFDFFLYSRWCVCDSQSQIKFTCVCVCVRAPLIPNLISRLPSIPFSPHMMMFTHAKRNVVSLVGQLLYYPLFNSQIETTTFVLSLLLLYIFNAPTRNGIHLK